MGNEVFVNDREVACKAADGKSVCAFPDVCMTPPECPATPPGVPVPYPNTAYAKDTAAGSKTVKISGKPVILKNKSYFKKSTGDEAGCASKKGVVTGVNRGKAYFNSWSMNVKVEGLNACRHMDLMTHNHGSKPGNTAVWTYLDTKVKTDCKEVCKKIESSCGGNPKDCFKNGKDEKDKKKEKTKPKDQYAADKKKMKKNLLKQLDKIAEKNGWTLKKEDTWKDKECFPFFLVKPGGLDEQLESIQKQIDSVEKGLKEAPSKLKSLNLDWGFILKEGASAIVPDSIIDILPLGRAKKLKKAFNMAERSKMVKEALQSASETVTETFKKTQDFLQNLKTQKDLIQRAKNSSPKEIADMQEAAAKANKCIKARKCLLEPYSSSAMPKSLFSKQGCCSGQTAHHILPDSFFRDDKTNTNIPDCKGATASYTHGSAPTVCVEGGNSSGSHGKMHTLTNKYAEKEISDGKLTYEGAKKAALKAHQKTFGNMACGKDAKCLEAQLDSYFKERCTENDFRVSPKKTTPGGGWLDGASPYPGGKER